MELINAKVNQLEMEINFQEALNLQLKTSIQTFEESIIPNDLIPFLVMYVSLNYNHISPNNSIKNRRQKKSSVYYWRSKSKEEGKLKKKIIKLASVCANELENSDSSNDTEIVSNLCAKKFKKISNYQSSPGSKDQQILSLFDKMFYGVKTVGEQGESKKDIEQR